MNNHDLTATSEAFEGPVRTCIGCRARDEQRNLLRIARTPVTSATEQADTPALSARYGGNYARARRLDSSERKVRSRSAEKERSGARLQKSGPCSPVAGVL